MDEKVLESINVLLALPQEETLGNKHYIVKPDLMIA